MLYTEVVTLKEKRKIAFNCQNGMTLLFLIASQIFLIFCLFVYFFLTFYLSHMYIGGFKNGSFFTK